MLCKKDGKLCRCKICGKLMTRPRSIQEASLQTTYREGDPDYIYAADSPDWDIFNQAGDVTLDFWIKLDSNRDTIFLGQYGDPYLWFHYFDDYQLGVYYGGSTVFLINCVGITNWTHLALCKVDGYGWGLYKNGIQLNYRETIGPLNITGRLWIGALGTSSNLGGHIDEFHISFSNVFGAAPNVDETDTIDVPTSRHTVTDDTKVLLHFDGADGSTVFTDATGRHTFTAVKTAQLDAGDYVELGS